MAEEKEAGGQAASDRVSRANLNDAGMWACVFCSEVIVSFPGSYIPGSRAAVREHLKTCPEHPIRRVELKLQKKEEEIEKLEETIDKAQGRILKLERKLRVYRTADRLKRLLFMGHRFHICGARKSVPSMMWSFTKDGVTRNVFGETLQEVVDKIEEILGHSEGEEVSGHADQGDRVPHGGCVDPTG